MFLYFIDYLCRMSTLTLTVIIGFLEGFKLNPSAALQMYLSRTEVAMENVLILYSVECYTASAFQRLIQATIC